MNRFDNPAVKAIMGSKGSENIGNGFAIPISIEDRAFIQQNINSEHFKCFARCAEAYKAYVSSRLSTCKPELLLQAQGQLQGINACINLLKHAAEFDVKPPEEND